MKSIQTPTKRFLFDKTIDIPLTPSSPSSVAFDLSFSPMSSTRSMSPTIRKNSIGTAWSIELNKLRRCGSTYEVALCLRNVCELLTHIDKNDRIKYCKQDFLNSYKIIRKNKRIWTSELTAAIYNIETIYFNESFFQILPTILIQEILQWLPLADFSAVPCVCKEWKKLGSTDEIWRHFYDYKFIRFNPGTSPVSNHGFHDMYRRRVEDPQVGDRVEVSWNGKFRLESIDVYHGLAWWVAVVVDKHTSQSKYKIHYPGWDSRWDEWVPRSRLRWTVDTNVLESIRVNDIVELWCCGAHVPGAWLESYVRKVKNGRYCVGKVLSSGSLWVERDRLRLVRRGADETQTITKLSSPRKLLRSITSFRSTSIDDDDQNIHRSTCVTM
mmetsp:Transcript_16116/g.14570  ORF Transcript_16116/g.14570 Transcript_16116/m.14570 type:complete len:383 (-) Transcript_16116:200-1348(-)